MPSRILRNPGDPDPEHPPRDPDALPDSSDPSGPCPRCGRPSNFQIKGNGPLTYKPDVFTSRPDGGMARLPLERVSILECGYCQQGIVVIEEERVGGVRGGKSGTAAWHGIHWWPTPGAGALGADVPSKVASAYDEAVRALSARAPNASMAMFRTAMSYMVEDHGSAEAKSKADLKDKIKQMVNDGGPMAAVGDWATHVRLYGNAGAHPDLFGDVSVDEAREVARLVHTMLELLYVLPANIAKRQAERRPQ